MWHDVEVVAVAQIHGARQLERHGAEALGWDVEEYRTAALAPRLARCVQPQLRPYALIVSGASACNKWAAKPNKEPEAAAYAELGEEDKEVQREKAKQAAQQGRGSAPSAG